MSRTAGRTVHRGEKETNLWTRSNRSLRRPQLPSAAAMVIRKPATALGRGHPRVCGHPCSHGDLLIERYRKRVLVYIQLISRAWKESHHDLAHWLGRGSARIGPKTAAGWKTSQVSSDGVPDRIGVQRPEPPRQEAQPFARNYRLRPRGTWTVAGGSEMRAAGDGMNRGWE